MSTAPNDKFPDATASGSWSTPARPERRRLRCYWRVRIHNGGDTTLTCSLSDLQDGEALNPNDVNSEVTQAAKDGFFRKWLRIDSAAQLVSGDNVRHALDMLWDSNISDAREECKRTKVPMTISPELDSRTDKESGLTTWRASVKWKNLTNDAEIVNEWAEPVFLRINQEGTVKIVDPPGFKLRGVEAEDPWDNPYNPDAPVFESSSGDEVQNSAGDH